MVNTEVSSHFYKHAAPFQLSGGAMLPEFDLAYEIYGEMNAAKDNVVLLFHALSGSQHAAGENSDPDKVLGPLWNQECHPGWWDAFIGPGLAVDTDRFCVICVNYLGGCYGSTGPGSTDPRTSKPYGASFPQVNASDIVDSQLALLDHLGIAQLHAVIGNSVGGLLALNLATRYPDRVSVVIPVATAIEVSHLQHLLILEQVLAIENDPHFNGGDYYEGTTPDRGLALARMISHKTFISLRTIQKRARREVVKQEEDQLSWYKIESPLESYMLHQGNKFVARFDANTYLRILDVWQKFNLLKQTEAESYTDIFSKCRHQKYLVFSISSDVCFYPDQQQALVSKLKAAKVKNMYITVHSEKGHDSFLLEPELYTPHLHYALNGD
ncbi:MAG: homoserine O-acetyltransferase [Verrucomicrobiales bacterium]|jgi:homoserine O-acetyltransferase